MTFDEFLKGIFTLEESLNTGERVRFKISDKKDTLLFWYSLFENDSPQVFMMAIGRVISTSEFAPTVAAIRKQIEELTNPVARFTADDAWGEVTKAIRNFGTYRETEALESMSPITRKIVTAMGYKLLCLSEDQMVDRAHFLKMFEQYKDRERKEYMLPDSLKTETVKIGNDPIKMLADGMKME